jgi:hypothetical protein
LAAAMGCRSTTDVVGEPPSFTPVDEGGRFRVTFGSGPDVVRGFLPDRRLLFRTFGLDPFGADWVLASAPVDGGQVREELGVYRPALLDDLSHLVIHGTERVLMLWKAAVPGMHGCPDSSLTTQGSPGPAPRTPSPVGVTLFGLPPADGTPVAAIPSRFVNTNVVDGTATLRQRVRVTPAVREVDSTGGNAFGPVIVPGSGQVIYSDGEVLWRASITDTSAAPQPLGPGAYPALSADARTLAYARPMGLDSTSTTYSVPVGPLAVCVEEFVTITAAAWEVVLRDLETGADQVLTVGRDPVFDPITPRVVVRRDDLRWVDLVSGSESPIPLTTGAFAPALSADGGILAFSLITPGAYADVFFLRLTR